MESLPELSVLVLPNRHPTADFLADVRKAEKVGVRTVWTYDHLIWPMLKDGPWYGAVPLMAAAAGATSSVRLGIQVATPNFRHPVPFAKELITLDQLSGGRRRSGWAPEPKVLTHRCWATRRGPAVNAPIASSSGWRCWTDCYANR